MWRLLIIPVLAISSSVGFAQSGGQSARWHQSGCQAYLERRAPKSVDEAADLGKCVGVVEATMKMAPLIEKTRRFCIPPAATTAEGVTIAVRYMAEHPEHLDRDFIPLILVALDEKWPCPK